MAIGILLLAVAGMAADTAVYHGPGRFCGYSPIIDLRAGESVTPLQGGVHGGTFRWAGPWGGFAVTGIGHGAKPAGRAQARRTSTGQLRFGPRREGNAYVVAIWNGRHGTAWFRSATAFTPAQSAAIDRVDLFEEGEDPAGCAFRTVFSWE